ncbi:MAG: response regulator transcription factor [Chloroflexota bacterium]|nr:response regulator transcription factor [Chloroflexota bacterium]
MENHIQVGILDDHQTIADGYRFRLQNEADIEVIFSHRYGESLEQALTETPVDVLLLDIEVPTSPTNPNTYPLLYLLPNMLNNYQDLSVIIISMHAQRTMISTLMEAGVRGYVLKEDVEAIRGLASLIRSIADGGVYMSQHAYDELMKSRHGNFNEPLSPRQLEALSLCAAYPDDSMAEIAQRLGVAHSTMRNLLSKIYLKLDVHSRTAAITKARNMGLYPPE